MNQKRTLYVSSLTYKRPEQVPQLLAGLNALDHPESWNVRFLIVDNDPSGSARSEIEAARSWFGGNLEYVVETTAGIPTARNRALKTALDANAALLCFLDDDETPERNWLTELVSCWERNGAALIGGPVKRLLPDESLSALQRLLGKSMVARRNLTDGWVASGAVSGMPRVYTNNWLCDLDAAREHDLWFDESLQFTGGSDMAFYLAAHRKGLRTGWCPTAIVYETLDPERMTIGYQFARGRSQGVVKAAVTNASWLRVIATQVPRAIIGAGLLILPVFGLGSYSLGLHLLGSATGYFSHLIGGTSSIYAYGRSNS